MAGAVRVRLRGEEGSTVLEAALVLPITVLFAFGVLQLCLFVCCFVGATFSSRAAVRYAEVHGAAAVTICTVASLQNIVKPYTAFLPASTITITPTWSPNNVQGSTVSVKVALSYPTGIPGDKLGTLSVSTTAQGIVVQ
jgi:hypothetical protein